MTAFSRPLLSAVGLAGALALTACIPPSPEPTPAPAPAPPPVSTPAPTPPPVPVTPAAVDWRDAPVTPGDWTYVSEPGETLAIFGRDRTRTGVELIIRCDLATRRIGIARAASATGPVRILIRTETQNQELTASPADGPAPLVATEMSPLDPLLDAIAFSKGRFTVETPATNPLIAPAWPEITRVIEDCRN